MSKSVSLDDIEVASSANFFIGLDGDHIEAFLKTAVVIEEEKGNLLFSQGDHADRFYILLEGGVKLFTANEDGDESIVEIFDSVTSFAEAAMFASARFPVNCETVGKTRLIRLDKGPFMRTLQERPEIAKALLKKLALSYRHLLDDVIQLKTQSPAQRLGAFFLSLVEKHEGCGHVELPYGKNLIAARVGMKPESLSRALVRLRELGVSCEKNKLEVSDLEKLRQFCSDGV